MNIEKWSDRLLKEQIKSAKLKDNKEYLEMLNKELEKRKNRNK